VNLFQIIFPIVIFTSIISPAFADITIIEVEANPAGPDDGNEWAILFNSGDKQVSLSGWGIMSTKDGKSYDLSGNIGKCEQKNIFFSEEFVSDKSESLVLFDRAGKVIDTTPTFSDVKNNTSTWKTTIPNCELLQNPPLDSSSVVESISENVNTTSEIIENDEHGAPDLGITIQSNGELIKKLTPILPYLGIILVLVIVAIIIINKKKRRHSKNNERDMESEYTVLENAPFLKKFQDLQVKEESKITDGIHPRQIIKNKLRIISELQDHKFGDNNRLDAIKKSLKTGDDFTKEDNDYLETKYDEYKKKQKNDSE